MMYKVLLPDRIYELGMEILKIDPDIRMEIRTDLNEKKLADWIGDYDAVIVRSTTQVTEAVIRVAANLKVIGRAGSGFENVDVDAATKHGIIVMNTPDANTISVAEHTIVLMLASARHVPKGDSSLRRGLWLRDELVGSELFGKSLGIIGLGRIGREVAIRALAFGMNVVAHDPFVRKQEIASLKIDLVELRQLLMTSDYVTIHVPLVPDTMNMINKDEISLMTKSARLINCARGGIVNEEALYNALKQNRITAAALDVFENEPLERSRLAELDNVVLTPHLGAATVEAKRRVGMQIAQQVSDALKGIEFRNVVNPGVLENSRPQIRCL